MAFGPRFQSTLNACKTLDLFDHFDFSAITPLEIIFYIENLMDNEIDTGLGIYMEERNKVLKRRLLSSNILSYSGPALETKNLCLGRDIKAVVSLSQINAVTHILFNVMSSVIPLDKNVGGETDAQVLSLI